MLLGILALFAILAVLPMVSAATMTAPVSGGNYTKTLTVTVTVGGNGANNMTNVSCLYNATGGATGTYLVDIINTTAYQTTFTGSASLTSETATYNVSCKVQNLTTLNTTLYASGITIDGTNPIVSISRDNPSVSMGRLESISWSGTDTHLKSTAVTITSPDADRCPTLSYTDAVKTVELSEDQVQCKGEYTATILSTDYTGNTATDSATFEVTIPDGKFVGDKSLQSISDQNGSNGGSSKAILLVLAAVAAYFLFKKK